MKLSVVIVNYNTKDLLDACLSSLQEELDEIPHEIIVVDNASSDGSGEMIKKAFPSVLLIENADNVGFPRANNQVLKSCRGEAVLLLNPDTVVLPGMITRMIGFLEGNKAYGAVGPKITRPDGSIQLECASNFPDLWNMFCELTMLSRIFRGSPLFGRWRMTYWDHQDSRDVRCLLGAAILMRRHILDNIGLLDEHMYIEDVDLCYRILKEGWKIRYLSTAGLIHFDGASRKASKHFYYHYQIAWNGLWHFFRKHRGWVYAMLFRLMTFVFSLLGLVTFSCASLISAIRGNPGPCYSDKLEKTKAVFQWSITPSSRFEAKF